MVVCNVLPLLVLHLAVPHLSSFLDNAAHFAKVTSTIHYSSLFCASLLGTSAPFLKVFQVQSLFSLLWAWLVGLDNIFVLYVIYVSALCYQPLIIVNDNFYKMEKCLISLLVVFVSVETPISLNHQNPRPWLPHKPVGPVSGILRDHSAIQKLHHLGWQVRECS